MGKGRAKAAKPIVWAMDVLEGNNKERKPLAQFLHLWAKGDTRAILPFSVASPGGLRWPVPVTKDFAKDLKDFGLRTLKKELRALGMSGANPPEVKVTAELSRRELAQEVVAYAKKKKAAFIAVNTRSEKSGSLLGGFAEALVERSDLPVLAVGPDTRVAESISSVLYPTDFSRSSHSAFQKTLAVAAGFGASLDILFVLQDPVIPYAGMDFGASATWIMESEALLLEENRKTAEKWCKEARAVGITCIYRVLRTGDSKARAITRFAKAGKFDLIALASYRSPRTPSFLGGNTRKIIAGAQTPVMEIRSN